MTQWTLSIGEVSVRAGVATSALRYYESNGLIFSERTSGNQRRYHRSTLRRVALIQAGQRFGLSLNEIRMAMKHLPRQGAPTAGDWARLSTKWRERIDEEITRLERLRDRATSCIGCGCLSLEVCGLLNPQDTLGQTGSGARRLDPVDSTR